MYIRTDAKQHKKEKERRWRKTRGAALEIGIPGKELRIVIEIMDTNRNKIAWSGYQNMSKY